MLQRDFFSKSSKCGLAHLCMMPSIYESTPNPPRMIYTCIQMTQKLLSSVYIILGVLGVDPYIPLLLQRSIIKNKHISRPNPANRTGVNTLYFGQVPLSNVSPIHTWDPRSGQTQSVFIRTTREWHVKANRNLINLLHLHWSEPPPWKH